VIWVPLVLCTLGLSSCTAYRGPRTADPAERLPETALTEKATEFEYYDAIEIRFTDGSSVKRQFRGVDGDQLLSFKGRGDSREEFSDPLESISGIRSREFAVGKTFAATMVAVGAGIVIWYMYLLSQSDFGT
jgi:hypothetical protein